MNINVVVTWWRRDKTKSFYGLGPILMILLFILPTYNLAQSYDQLPRNDVGN